MGRKKWMILTIYTPPEQSSRHFVEEIPNPIDRYAKFGNVMILGDLNLET